MTDTRLSFQNLNCYTLQG